MEKKVYIFVSHSHKDIERVRIIRNYLESLDSEPILFFLKSLDDDDEITKLIKDEIDARLWFIYCKSKNSEESKWVRTELEHIKSTNKQNTLTIDLDEAFDKYGNFKQSEMARISSIINIIKYNYCFYVSYSQKDKCIYDRIASYLNKFGISFYSDKFLDAENNWLGTVKNAIKTSKYFLLLFSANSLKSRMTSSEIKEAFMKEKVIVPVLIDLTLEQIRQADYETYELINGFSCFIFDSQNVEKSSNELIYQLVELSKKTAS